MAKIRICHPFVTLNFKWMTGWVTKMGDKLINRHSGLFLSGGAFLYAIRYVSFLRSTAYQSDDVNA